MQLISHFIRSAKRHPERAAFIQPDGRALSYSDAAAIVQSIAAELRGRDVPTDAKVAIFSPNDAKGFLAMLGTVAAGLAWVSLNPRNTIEDNIALAQTAEARILFFHSKFEAEAQTLVSKVDGLDFCICLDRASPLGGSLADLPSTATGPWPDLVPDNERPCTIFATGGTTGQSKGAVWTNRTWETLIANFWTSAPPCDHPVHLCVAPMTHGAGALALMLLPRAPTNVLMTSADPEAILQAIDRHKVTHVFLPPTILYALLSCAAVRNYDTSSLAFFLISAAPVAPDKLREAIDVFGPVMCQAFGQAESPFFLTYLSATDHALAASSQEHAHLLQSCGRATMFSEVEIMDEDGAILGERETGEIVSRGNLTMAGYYKDPDATADVSAHGWHHTGDIGYKDERGYIYIVDRKRDMIISGGFNVFSTEVESALLSHPAILDCAVVGVPDDKWGEAVKAVVELKPGASGQAEDLIAHCKALLGSVKSPKTLEIWETLPRSPVGKVLKRSIRERYWQGQSRAV